MFSVLGAGLCSLGSERRGPTTCVQPDLTGVDAASRCGASYQPDTKPALFQRCVKAPDTSSRQRTSDWLINSSCSTVQVGNSSCDITGCGRGKRGHILIIQVSGRRETAGFFKPQRHKPDVTSCCPKMSRSDRKEDSGRTHHRRRRQRQRRRRTKEEEEEEEEIRRRVSKKGNIQIL